MKKAITRVIAFLMIFSCFITVSAAELKNKYKLSFDTNGVQAIEDQWYEENSEIHLPKKDINGYMFVGWYSNKEFTELFTLKKMPNKDITVYGLYAVALSELTNKINNIDIEKAISDMKVTPDEFNKLANNYGFKISYTINGKQYIVQNIINYMDEIIGQSKKVIAKGETVGMTVTIKLGKNDIGNTYTFNIYNDIADTLTDITEKTESSSENINNTLLEEIPKTGSKLTVPVILILFVGSGIAVIIIRRKQHGKR